MSDVWVLAVLFLVAAVLYSSVGHAGASGYLAAMALLGVAAATMKPTALVLNIVVASITTYRYWRVGQTSWSLLWPFASLGVPAAFLGGWIQLPGHFYKPLVGAVLLLAATRMAWIARRADTTEVHPPKWWIAMLCGGVIGLLSGLTGTGGGIFLSPLLLFMGWSNTRIASGVAAAFILVNSIAGLAGNLSSVRSLPAGLSIWIPTVIVGALIGTELGCRRLPTAPLRYLLAAVLIVAGLKLCLA
jgi:uncharacterized protein